MIYLWRKLCSAHKGFSFSYLHLGRFLYMEVGAFISGCCLSGDLFIAHFCAVRRLCAKTIQKFCFLAPLSRVFFFFFLSSFLYLFIYLFFLFLLFKLFSIIVFFFFFGFYTMIPPG